MKIECPFLELLPDIDEKPDKCVYLEDDCYCDEIETAPGNSDAWCREKLEATNDSMVTAIIKWLEGNQPDVFERGLWDAINENRI